MIDLVIFTLAHSRPKLLPLIVEQAQQLCDRGLETRVEFGVDHETEEVFYVLEDLLLKNPKLVSAVRIPFQVVDDKEHFMEARNVQLASLRRFEPRYAALWDDDHLMEYPYELLPQINKGTDLIYSDKVYFWDSLHFHNIGLPLHRSVLAFKVRPGDTYPLDRTINAPQGVHDDPAATKKVLESRLLDIGYMTSAERWRVFKVYKDAGKIDALTMGLMAAPTLKRFIPKYQKAYRRMLDEFATK